MEGIKAFEKLLQAIVEVYLSNLSSNLHLQK